MKDEIKEILEITETADYKRLSFDEIVILEDYITNFQEKNNNLKEDFKRHIDRINELTERNEKAVEYIKEHKRHEYRNGNDNEYYLELDEDKLKELLNILQGSDK